MQKVIRLSVRRLVEFLLRTGDIDNRFLSNRRALEGIRLHQKIQNQYPTSFQKEVFLRGEKEKNGFAILLEGRADGLYEGEDEILIDEIKSTLYSETELKKKPNPLHWAQLKCYGWILCKEKELDSIELRLTYIHVESESVFYVQESFSSSVLNDFVQSLIDKYWKIQEKINIFTENKKQSIHSLSFPYPSFRKGQRQLAVATYNMIQKKGTLLAQAPTGIGKTLATLFPAIKSMDTESTELIFYGTSRSTQKNLAKEAHKKLKKQGLRLKSIALTAKEKICINDVFSCNPKECPYAKGHYDRVFSALFDSYDREDIFDQTFIQDIALEFQICPFEFQLDLSDYCDLIIGDYNYIFHPKSNLERLMSNTKRMKSAILLIDEAHNLVDRGRDMYSTYLDGDIIQKALETSSLSKTMVKRISQLQEALSIILNQGQGTYEEIPSLLDSEMESLRFSIELSLAKTKEEPKEELLDLYFRILDWQDLLLYFNKEEFILFVPKEADKISLLCLDPSTVLEQTRKKFASVVYFSATLMPFQYHAHLLGAGKDVHFLDLPSPFDPGNFLILHPKEIQTTYKHRNKSLKDVVRYMKVLTESHEGNYLFFFPSYSYMEMCFEANRPWDRFSHKQERKMTEKERQGFINSFEKNKRLHGYAVMGGVFSEGIDLVGQALEGAVIVSLALPGLSPERDLIKRTFNKRGLPGFDYAYTIPGIIKVLQAAGRIIRDEEDKGLLILLDQRFADPKIQSILPKHWQIIEIHSSQELKNKVKEFWR